MSKYTHQDGTSSLMVARRIERVAVGMMEITWASDEGCVEWEAAIVRRMTSSALLLKDINRAFFVLAPDSTRNQ